MSKTLRDTGPGSGPIAWMVHHRVTPNLLMLIFLIGGFYMATQIKKEVFPEFEIDTVTVRVPYPGASPEEVEQGIVLAIEEAVRSLEGVDEVRASASEGSGSVTVELIEGADRQKAYQDIQQEVDRITTFPDDAEEPEVTLNFRRHDVLDIELFGDVSERALREAADHVRDRLLQIEGVTQVELDGARDLEIHVEIPEETLRRYDLTLQEVAAKIRSSAVEVPGGKIETQGGEVLLRVDERRDWSREYAELVILATPDGSVLRLGDIAHVYEGFEDTNNETRINGGPAIGIDVYRVGDQTPIGVSDAVRAVLPQIEAELPPGVNLVVRIDDSDIYRQRLNLLFKNAFFGLLLVLALLGLFLEFKLAFWVTMGIPISFLGGMLFLPFLGVSFNMISMFAFIVALGIVVDDAIVAGENIYEYREQGMSLIDAAVRGARDVAMPVTFAILTNVAAFTPLAFVPGFIGKIWGVIPLVVCTVFIISLIEALIILPAHLAHTGSSGRTAVTRWLHARQQAFSRGFRRFVEHVYGPFLDLSLRYRSVTLAIGFGVLILVLALIGSGRLGFIFMPRVESDRAVVTATLPLGSPIERGRAVSDRLLTAAQRVIDDNGRDQLATGAFTQVTDSSVRVTIYLTEPGVRPISTGRFTQLWRTNVGAIPDIESLRFEADRGGPGSGAALTVELSHRDIDTLDRASQVLAQRLGEFSVVEDIDDGYSAGKPQFNFRITPLGESLGLDAQGIARQIRASFQGAEAIKQQRGRDEVTVRVRRPEAERLNVFDVEKMMVRTPDGGEVPLFDVAQMEPGRAYTTIRRRDGRRTVSVTADVDPIGEVGRVKAALTSDLLPQLAEDFPGLTHQFRGRQASFDDSFRALGQGMVLALLVIYVLLAVPFRSYTQPLIVMLAIPFGIVGAALGHVLMGYNLSIISVMGIVALAGVVVNDSLVLIEYTNRLIREKGLTPHQAIRAAGVRRFRPILLTTLTTFGGLAPMIFETSRQARFMIPMAISLGYGILFATVITLLILPCLYLVLEDVKMAVRLVWAPDPHASPQSTG